MAGSCFSLLPLFGIFIPRWLLRKNRDACHVPPKTSSEFYQTFVCVIHPTAKCCCSGNLHKRTSLWLFLQILLYYNFRWHNISESRILDFINYLWYILPRPAVADVIVDFSHLNLLPTYQSTLDLDESSRWSISKNHHFQSQGIWYPTSRPWKFMYFWCIFLVVDQTPPRPCGQAVHALAWSVFGNTTGG